MSAVICRCPKLSWRQQPSRQCWQLQVTSQAHPSLWSGLTEAACLNAAQHLDDPSYCLEGTAVSSSQGDVPAESRLLPEQDTLRSSSSGHAFDNSERRPRVCMLPVQLLRHMQTLQQDIDADIWQMLWCLYATEDMQPGALHTFGTSCSLGYTQSAICVFVLP